MLWLPAGKQSMWREEEAEDIDRNASTISFAIICIHMQIGGNRDYLKYHVGLKHEQEVSLFVCFVEKHSEPVIKETSRTVNSVQDIQCLHQKH